MLTGLPVMRHFNEHVYLCTQTGPTAGKDKVKKGGSYMCVKVTVSVVDAFLLSVSDVMFTTSDQPSAYRGQLSVLEIRN